MRYPVNQSNLSKIIPNSTNLKLLIACYAMPESDDTDLNINELMDMSPDLNEVFFEVDQEGETLLMAAMRTRNEKMIKGLLSKNVEVNYRNQLGATALRRAISEFVEDHVGLSIVESLLRSGASMKVKDHSNVTPYKAAQYYNKLKFIALMDAYKEKLILEKETAPLKKEAIQEESVKSRRI